MNWISMSWPFLNTKKAVDKSFDIFNKHLNAFDQKTFFDLNIFDVTRFSFGTCQREGNKRGASLSGPIKGQVMFFFFLFVPFQCFYLFFYSINNTLMGHLRKLFVFLQLKIKLIETTKTLCNQIKCVFFLSLRIFCHNFESHWTYLEDSQSCIYYD